MMELTEEQMKFLAFMCREALDVMCDRDGFEDEDWVNLKFFQDLAHAESARG